MAKAKRPDSKAEQEGPERLPNGTFAPGSSGNANGVPKWLKEFRDAFGQRCAPKAEQVLNRMLERALDTSALDGALKAEDARVRVAAEERIAERMRQGGTAADIVLKYLVPKPTQAVDVSVTDKRDAFAGLTAEQLVELAKQKPKEEGQ